MTTNYVSCVNDSRLSADGVWAVSRSKRFRANIIVWGVPKHFSTLEIRSKFADIGLSSFVSGKVVWEGDHVRLVPTAKDSKGISKHVVSQVSARLRKIGYRCVLDEQVKSTCSSDVASLKCVNRFDLLVDEECSSQKCNSKVNVDLEVVSSKVKTLGNKKERSLRVATWNFSGLCSERKQKEVGELLVENMI